MFFIYLFIYLFIIIIIIFNTFFHVFLIPFNLRKLNSLEKGSLAKVHTLP
jgi:hypothetical protein